jgi:hypothetical protein
MHVDIHADLISLLCIQILDYLGKSSDSDPPSPVEHLSCRSR